MDNSIKSFRRKAADNSVLVFAPATVANMGPGFDIMGMALQGAGDILEIQVQPGDQLIIRNLSGVNLPDDIEKNVITPAVRSLLNALGARYSVTVTVHRKILPGSGIGSSSASSAAAVKGLNELLGNPFTDKELVCFAMEGERLVSGGTAHADNAGPAVCGGIMLIRGYDPLDYLLIPVPDSLYAAVVHPHITVNTLESRAVMPREIPIRDAVTQWGNVGGLVAGLITSDLPLVGRSLRDVVAEPHRKCFIPGYDQLKNELAAAGALASNIAGSGPSVFALCSSRESLQRCAATMRSHFDDQGIPCDVYADLLSREGARILERK